MAEDGHAEERAKLRALAMGPCKQACLLLGDMSFTAFRAQLKANAAVVEKVIAEHAPRCCMC